MSTKWRSLHLVARKKDPSYTRTSIIVPIEVNSNCFDRELVKRFIREHRDSDIFISYDSRKGGYPPEMKESFTQRLTNHSSDVQIDILVEQFIPVVITGLF